ncbi:MAG: glycosyl hydrolase, repeat [Acidobacteria bacterium]|nr:glycosyl hydrolase, repeat [Acidobacteriota bacterium]
MRIVRPIFVLIIPFLVVVSGGAQPTPLLDPSLLGTLRWRSVGPANTGGRIDDFAVARVPGQPDAIYVATASGGIFKSTNQGTSWTPIFDRVDAMMSIGDITVATANPNVVWAGTGEANNRQSSSWGDGVYKSTDAGQTWARSGLADTRHIARIVIHPRNPDVVYVAAAGHLWGPNSERGVFKTVDGGRTWTKALYVDDNTGATDLVMDPQDPQTLFAAMYQRQRKAWGFNGGGPGSGIFRSRDAGATWTRLSNGLPQGDKGRIGLDIFHADPRVILAVVEAAGRDNGVYRSADGGDTWQAWSTLNPRPMYYSQIRVDPKDAARVYLLGSNRGFYTSNDAGRTFTDVFSTVHSEDHALWIDPDDTNHLIVGGDGGVSISWDRGQTWLFRDNLPVGQFYEISADMQDPYVVCGGLQDNGHWCVPSATRLRSGISNHDAFNIGSGDGFYARIDPTDPRTAIIESQDGRANRVNLSTFERQVVAPLPPDRLPKGERERWNWNAPILMSSFDPKTLYMGSNVVFKTVDRGATWRPISPDLTANIDRESLELMGGRVPERALSRHDGITSFSTLTTISESPLDARLLYTGSDDGRLMVTRDAGQKWTALNERVPGLPPGTYVSSVLSSRHKAGRVYATFDGHYNDDYRTYVYASDDYGQTWRAIASGLPITSAHKLREHPRNPRLLFLAHERGIHVSVDEGASWSPLTLNMPNVPVDDILVHPRDNDLIAGTHGRGIWILDNISALEALTPAVLQSDAFLVPPARARLLTVYSPQAWYGAGQFFAPNPDFGATIDYYLRAASNDEVTVTASDARGAIVRVLKGTARAGINRVSWDMRFEPPVADGRRDTPSGGGFGGPPAGPLVLPGTYTITLAAAGRSLKSELRIEGDPRVTFSVADRRTRQTALLNLYALQKSLSAARAAGATAAGQLDTPGGRGLTSSRADASSRLVQVQADLVAQFNTVNSLSRAIEGYSGLPTADQRRQVDWAFDDAARAVAAMNTVLHTDAAPSRLTVPAKLTKEQ